MTSVDGTISLLGDSDETHEFVCGPCKTEIIEKEARHYCVECQENLCGSCKQSHHKLKISEHHEVLSGTRLPKHASSSQRPICTVHCSCNQNREVEIYCEDHDDVICNSCKMLSHPKCEISFIQDKTVNYTSTKLDSVLKKTKIIIWKSLKDQISQLQQEMEENRSKLEIMKDEGRREIITFREELNNFLDKLEQNMLKELDEYIKEQNIFITEHISSLTMTFERLDSEFEMLNQAKQFDRKEPMFASEMKVSKSLKEYEVLIADMQKYVMKPALSFERNRILVDIQRDVDTFGCLKLNTEVANRRKERVLLGLKIQSSSQVDVALPDDKGTPWISGSCFMPNGYLVVCDLTNKKLKLLDSSFALQDNLKCNTWPYDVSVIDDNNVIISLPNKKQLQYIQVFPKMKAERVIQLDKYCYAIHTSGDELYTSCKESYQGEVRVLDINGNIKRRIGVNQDGSYLFKCPNYLTVSRTDKKIFISDWKTNTVTCMSAGGHIIYQNKDSELKGSRGIYVDAEDNIYVCGRDTGNVLVITADGRNCGTLISSNAGIKNPCSIAFRDSDRTLVVGCEGESKLFRF